MKANSKDKTKAVKLLRNYRYLINSVSHFSNIKDLDKRMFSFTIHVKSVNDLSKIKGVIALKLNKFITGETYSISPLRPAIIICDDVEGSRDFNPNLDRPVYSHFHGIIIIPSEVFDQITDRKKFIADMEKAILAIHEVRSEPLTWKAKLSVSNSEKFTNLLSAIQRLYPCTFKETAPNEAELTYYSTDRRDAIECDILLANIQNEFPEITNISRMTSFTKMADIHPYDQSKGSVFNLLDYSMKLMDSSHASFDFRVFPFESDISRKRHKWLGVEAKRKADLWYRMCLSHPALMFSAKYLAEHGHEFERLDELNSHEKRMAA